MKKTNIILIGLILEGMAFFSLATFVLGSASYVGVKESDKYIWGITFDTDVYGDWELDGGATYLSIMDEFAIGYENKGIKQVIIGISNEYYNEKYEADEVSLQIMFYGTDKDVANDDWDLKGTWVLNISQEYHNYTCSIFWKHSPIFISKTTDYNSASVELEDYLYNVYGSSLSLCKVLGETEGYHIDCSFMGMSDHIFFNYSFNSRGALEFYEAKFGEDLLLEIELISQSSAETNIFIHGYTPLIFIGVVIVSILAITKFKLKKS